MNPALPRIYTPGGKTLDAVGARADRVIGSLRAVETAWVSVLGYDHDLSEPVIHAWIGRGT